MNDNEGLDLYPDIDDYLDNVDNQLNVSIQNLDDIVYKICAYTGLSYKESSVVLKSFFSVIRALILRGHIIYVPGFGKFFVSSPKVTNNKSRVFARFTLHRSLFRRLNSEED